MYTAVLFDMDGVLIDSEPGYNRADAELFARLGLVFGKREIAAITGSNDLVIGRMVKEWYPDLPFSAEEIAFQYAENLYASIQKDVNALIDGTEYWIDRLRELGIRTAIGSSSTSKMVQHIVERFKLASRMDCIVTGDDVGLGKPHPDIYLRCAELLGVGCENCLVIEDSINGILAAHNAKMRVAAYTGTNRHGLDLSAADYSFSRFDDESLKRLIEQA